MDLMRSSLSQPKNQKCLFRISLLSFPESFFNPFISFKQAPNSWPKANRLKLQLDLRDLKTKPTQSCREA